MAGLSLVVSIISPVVLLKLILIVRATVPSITPSTYWTVTTRNWIIASVYFIWWSSLGLIIKISGHINSCP